MSDSIMASLGLASFDVTVQPHLCKSRSGKEVTLTEGDLDTPLPRVCPECGGRMDRHDRHAVHVQGLPVLGRTHLLRVWVSLSRCRQCGHVESQKAGFVAQGTGSRGVWSGCAGWISPAGTRSSRWRGNTTCTRLSSRTSTGGDQAGYRLYKSCRFIVLSRPGTIRKRDRQAHEENLPLRSRILAGSIPRNTRLRREDRCLRLERLLEENGALYRCYLLVEKHLEGIIHAIVLGLSTGKLEGTNNMIKTTRRSAYGFRDTQYFFSKIYENSRKPSQIWLSHKILI